MLRQWVGDSHIHSYTVHGNRIEARQQIVARHLGV